MNLVIKALLMRKPFYLIVFLLVVCPHAVFALSGVNVEAALSETSPYVRQKLVYSVRVVSSISLSKVSVHPPSVAGIVLEKADGPRNSYRTGRDGQQLVVNEYRYIVTPLTPGYMEIPSAKVKVTPAESQTNGRVGNYYSYNYSYNNNYNPWQQQSFAYQSRPEPAIGEHTLTSNSVTLTIRPPIGHNMHWLPLYQAEIEGSLEGDIHQAVAGKPLTLKLIFRATGLGGDELPSLAQFLQSPKYKLYSGHPITTQGLSRDGTTLYGQREESFTIIPQETGPLILPEIRVSWWDLNHQRPAEVHWRPPNVTTVEASSESELSSQSTDHKPQEGIRGSIFMYLVVGLFSFVSGWWLGAGRPILSLSIPNEVMAYRSQVLIRISRLVRDARMWLMQQLPKTKLLYYKLLRKYSESVKRTLPLRSVLTTAHRLIEHTTPQTVKTVLLMRRVSRETDPTRIAKLLQEYAHTAMRLPANTSLYTIASEIGERYPHLDRAVVKSLFTTLDTSIYGSTQLDGAQWHEAFREVFMRVLIRRRFKLRLIDVVGLPNLNP